MTAKQAEKIRREIIEQIKAKAKEKGMSASDLAKATGRDYRQTIEHMLTGEHQIKLDSLIQLASAVGLTVKVE